MINTNINTNGRRMTRDGMTQTSSGERPCSSGGPMAAAAFWLALGLVAAGLWTDIVGYSVNLLSSDPTVGGTGFSDGFLLGRLFIAIVFIALARLLPRIQNALIGATALLMSVATGVPIISHHQTLIPPDLFSGVGVFVAGCGYPVLVLAFYVLLARKMPTEMTVWCIAISLVGETVFSILVSLYMPAALQMAVVLLAPVLAAACYFLASRLMRETPDQAFQMKAHRFDKYGMIVTVLIFGAALAFIRILSDVGIWGATRANFTGMTELSVSELVVISTVILVLSYLVFTLPRRRLTLSLRCLIGLAVMLGGLQILALTDGYQFGYLFDSVTTAIELFAHLVRWMIFIECIRKTDTPYFLIAGSADALYSLLTLTWAHWLSGLELATSTVVMVVVYVLVLMIMVILVRSQSIPGSVFWSEFPRGNKAAILSFSRRWGLSPRESEIFELLLQGMKRSEIEQTCSLSSGTVKTHISNIYKKMDIHSKRELIELFQTDSHEGPSDTEEDAG